MMRPSVAGPTGTDDRLAGVADHHAAAQAVGRAERDGADDAVAELLLHLERQRRAFHLQRVVDPGHLRRAETPRRRRRRCTGRSCPVRRWRFACQPCSIPSGSVRRIVSPSDRRRAGDDLGKFFGDRRPGASCCRSSFSSAITLPALSVADFIATIRADCSEAMFSAVRLVDQRLDVAHQQLVDHDLARRARRCSPSRACLLPSASARRSSGSSCSITGSWRIVLMKRV